MIGKLQLKSRSNRPKNILKNIKRHDHINYLYSSRDEQLSIIAEYLKKGLEQNEKCVYMAYEIAPEVIIDKLKENGVATEAAFSRGDLIVYGREYLFQKNGSFDPASQIELIRNLTASSRKEGYKNLRVANEIGQAPKDRSEIEKLLEYEAKLNDFVPRHNVIMLCQYDLRRSESRLIIQSIQAHPAVIYNNRLCDNIYYIPPAQDPWSDKTDDVISGMLRNIYLRKRLDPKAPKGAQLAGMNNRILEHEISEREKAIKVYKESESYFRRLINSAPVAIILTDKGGRCLFANRNWQVLTGLSLQDSIGVGWQKIIHVDYIGKIGAWWYKGEKKETDPGTECLIQTVSGNYKWIDLKSSPFIADNGDHVGYITSFTDITHRKENEIDMLRKARLLENRINK